MIASRQETDLTINKVAAPDKKPVMANNCCFAEHLRRMGLDDPQGLREELYQRLMLAGLQATS